MNLFLTELKKFSKQNWWIYIMFIISLFIIHITDSGNLFEVSIVFMFHFLGDLGAMMMGDFYSKKEDKKALYAQICSFTIFGLIGLYAGIINHKWGYMVPNLLFIWPIIKGFKPNLKFINIYFMMIVGVFVLFLYYYLGLINHFSVLIQIMGFIIFPLSLIIKNYKLKYFGNLIGISLIFIGSAFLLYDGYIKQNIVGVDLSYSLLPFTVFIYYLKLIKKYI